MVQAIGQYFVSCLCVFHVNNAYEVFHWYTEASKAPIKNRERLIVQNTVFMWVSLILKLPFKRFLASISYNFLSGTLLNM